MAGSDEQIYRKYVDELTRFAAAMVGPDRAGDAVSSAVVTTFTSKAWPQVTNPRAYLYRAVLNQCRMTVRHESRRRALETRTTRVETTTQRTPRPEVFAAVSHLSPRQRAVVFLTYWDDLDPARVAELLGISDGAVRRHLARARKHLKEALHE